MNPILGDRICGDCGANPGQFHQPGCDVERCAACGGQAISCGCYDGMGDEEFVAYIEELGGCLPWTGVWPTELEAKEAGLYSRWSTGKFPEGGGKWVECEKDHPDAGADLNRFALQFRWDPKARKYEVGSSLAHDTDRFIINESQN